VKHDPCWRGGKTSRSISYHVLISLDKSRTSISFHPSFLLRNKKSYGSIENVKACWRQTLAEAVGFITNTNPMKTRPDVSIDTFIPAWSRIHGLKLLANFKHYGFNASGLVLLRPQKVAVLSACTSTKPVITKIGAGYLTNAATTWKHDPSHWMPQGNIWINQLWHITVKRWHRVCIAKQRTENRLHSVSCRNIYHPLAPVKWATMHSPCRPNTKKLWYW